MRRWLFIMMLFFTTGASAVNMADSVAYYDSASAEALRQGDKEEAFYLMLDANSIRDSLRDVKGRKAFDEMYSKLRIEERILDEYERVHDTRMRWLYILVISLVVVAGLIIYFLISVRKMVKKLRISNRKLVQSNKDLEKANEEANATIAKKGEFIRHLSHEIRTPLNIINGYSEMLADDSFVKDEEGMQDILTHFVAASKNMSNITQNLITLSDLEAFKKIERNDVMTMGELCERALKESDVSEIEGIYVDIEGELLNMNIRTNADVLVKILTELLLNAAKFMRKGHIRMRCWSPSPELISFDVIDEGQHIPNDKSERIFVSFVKLDKFEDGLGIGLTVARNRALQLDGTLRYDVNYTEGNRFALEFKKTS